MNDFYLNKQFFDFLIDKSYPLGKDFYLHVYSRQTIGSGYKKFYRYEIDFEVFYEQSEFIPVFHGTVDLSCRKIWLSSVKYALESDVKQAYDRFLPLVPTWFLPCTNFHVWLRYCLISLNVYRKEDWI